MSVQPTNTTTGSAAPINLSELRAAAEAFVRLGRDYSQHLATLNVSPLRPDLRVHFQAQARLIDEACDQLSDVPALVEAVEAAQRLRGKHDSRTQWMGDKRALDAALARFVGTDTPT